VGTDFGSSTARSVNIRLMRPGVILPPNGTYSRSSPQQPNENDTCVGRHQLSYDGDRAHA
jgi:hypothetical protein